MNTSTVTTLRRAAVTTAAAVTLLAGMPGAASARPYPGDPAPTATPTVATAPLGGWPLERLGRQLVRGDNLTGAGTAAPLWVPERH